MSSPLVLITDSNLPTREVEESVLVPAGFRVARAECRTESDVLEAAQEADALIVQWAPITSHVLDGLDRCRIVSRLGIGLDMIDVGAATRRGIAVANTPDYCTEEVAAHTIALALSISRGVPSLEASLRRGEWAVAPNTPLVHRPSSVVFAVLGFGRIGSRVAEIAAAIGFDVVVHDRFVPDEEIRNRGFRPAGLEEALSAAGIACLHTPLTDETFQLVGDAELELLGEQGFLVNTSRGELIDEAALARALDDGVIAGAGLDVFASEPLATESPLRGAPNLQLTPHAAWYSAEALAELPRCAAENIVTFFAAGEAEAVVNPFSAERRRGAVAGIGPRAGER
jgi:D-3-phosphoglycerate dehydrogenase / 2-oxoglutarate reductase